MPGTGSSRKRKAWEEEKERLLSLTLEQRRQEYKDYKQLEDIPTLLDEYRKESPEGDSKDFNSLCGKVSLYKGDITHLEVDAIVNAANSSLLGGGGVDGCIHRASGSFLIAECRTLGGCGTGEAKITCGYQLPAKYVIHTVGPIARGQLSNENKDNLKKCYESSLALAKQFNIRSIAFPCISTGIYGFPNEPAADIALDIVKDWLMENQAEVDRIIFCVFLDIDYKLYLKKLPEVFPKDDIKEPGQDEDEKVKGPCPPASDGDKSDQELAVIDDMKEPGQESDENSSDKKESDVIDNDDKTEPDQTAEKNDTKEPGPPPNSDGVKEPEHPKDTDGMEESDKETAGDVQPLSSATAEVVMDENKEPQATQDDSQKQEETRTTQEDINMHSQIMESQEQSQPQEVATTDTISESQVMDVTIDKPIEITDEEMLSESLLEENSPDMDKVDDHDDKEK